MQQAKQVVEAIQHIDANFKVGDGVSLAALQNAMGLVEANQGKINSLQAQLTDEFNQRVTANTALWDMVKRIRGGIKAAYGDDSSQYEMAGGTRISERKKGGRKKATPST
jgi:hypothetical protein